MARLRKQPGSQSDSDSDDSLPELAELVKRSQSKQVYLRTNSSEDASTRSKGCADSTTDNKLSCTGLNAEFVSRGRSVGENPIPDKVRRQRVLRTLTSDTSLLNRIPPRRDIAKANGKRNATIYQKKGDGNQSNPKSRNAPKRSNPNLGEPEIRSGDLRFAVDESQENSDEAFEESNEAFEEGHDDSSFNEGTPNFRPSAGTLPPMSVSANPRQYPNLQVAKSHCIPPKYPSPLSSDLGIDEIGESGNYSPSRAATPRPRTPERTHTPLLVSPSKSRLVSPSKTRKRIPTPPHIHSSIDAFWQPDIINAWNDQYSPKKMLTPSKQTISLFSDSDGEFPSPCGSPQKNTSPQKKQREAKKAFDVKKHSIAEIFLKELDDVVASGKLASMTKSTGGVKLIWSKKLNSTAGRANWRREGRRVYNHVACPNGPPETQYITTYEHHASIELAEKVIDDEDRLINVLAHEFCHLTNIMISGIRTNPHGKEFKEWAHRVMAEFGNRGVKVTTKHSYTIAYKYVWSCLECGMNFKRHSKSIDPQKHRCGSCKGILVQTQPAPRSGGTQSEYQIFVKNNYVKVKKECEGKSQAVVMGKLGEMYREEKNRTKATTGSAESISKPDTLTGVLEKLTLDNA